VVDSPSLNQEASISNELFYNNYLEVHD